MMIFFFLAAACAGRHRIAPIINPTVAFHVLDSCITPFSFGVYLVRPAAFRGAVWRRGRRHEA